MVFYHHHELKGGFIGETQLLALTVTGFKFNLISHLSLKSEIQFDYNTEPGQNAKEEDVRYLVKFSYNFAGDETDWWQ